MSRASSPRPTAPTTDAARRVVLARRAQLVAAAIAAAAPVGCEKPRPCLSVAMTPPPRDPRVKNPADVEGRAILRDYHGDGCHVELPPHEPPQGVVPLATRPIECPASMLADPAWESCLGGEIRAPDPQKPDACTCTEHGDPPAERPNACPKP